MLPQSHVAYTWLVLSLAQDTLDVAPDADYRVVALAAMGSDLIDKPLAWAYFYEKQRAAVLFAHTLLAYSLVAWLTLCHLPRRFPGRVARLRLVGIAFLGHAVLDRIWKFHDTFYWPLRGRRFHEWKRQGSEQEKIGNAYWHAFTRRPELWIWEVGGMLALLYLGRRYRLWKLANLRALVVEGKPRRYPQ